MSWSNTAAAEGGAAGVFESVEKFSVVKNVAGNRIAPMSPSSCSMRKAISPTRMPTSPGSFLERGRAVVVAVNKWTGSC